MLILYMYHVCNHSSLWHFGHLEMLSCRIELKGRSFQNLKISKNLVAGGGEEGASYTLEDIKELEKTIKDLCSSIAQNEYMCNSRYRTTFSAFYICSY
jgi:hypothetical protein